jgi:KH domain
MDICTILGRGGATIRKLSIESGAKISMTSKDESIFTQERLLSITGTKTACVKCLSLVLSKLAEDTETNQFINKGTNYMTNINTYDYARIGGAGGRKGGPARGRGRGDMGRGRGRGSDESPSADSTAFDDISASTTISMAVPELLIGNILGKNVRYIIITISIINNIHIILTIIVYTYDAMTT